MVIGSDFCAGMSPGPNAASRAARLRGPSADFKFRMGRFGVGEGYSWERGCSPGPASDFRLRGARYPGFHFRPRKVRSGTGRFPIPRVRLWTAAGGFGLGRSMVFQVLPGALSPPVARISGPRSAQKGSPDSPWRRLSGPRRSNARFVDGSRGRFTTLMFEKNVFLQNRAVA